MAKLKKAKRELRIPGRRRLDFKKPGKPSIAREEERSGSRARMSMAINRLLTQKNAKKELGVPQKDMKKALEEVQKRKLKSVVVTNLTRTKRRRP